MTTAWVCGISGSGVRSVAGWLAESATGDTADPSDAAAGIVDAIAVRPADIPDGLPDICILVVSAEQGFAPDVAAVWHRCAEDFIPRICVWTHIDSGRTDDDELRAMAERVLDEEIFPLALPIAGDDEEFVAVLDLPHQKIHLRSEPALTADAEHISLSSPSRDELIAAAAATIDDAGLIDQLNLGLTPNGQRAWDAVIDAVLSGQLAVAIPTRPVEPAIGMTLVHRLLSAMNRSSD